MSLAQGLEEESQMLCIRYLELILESAEELTNKVRRGGTSRLLPKPGTASWGRRTNR